MLGACICELQCPSQIFSSLYWQYINFPMHVFRYGFDGTTNVQGEEVKKLDVLANDCFINMLKSSYATCLMVSEENETVIEVDTDHQVIPSGGSEWISFFLI